MKCSYSASSQFCITVYSLYMYVYMYAQQNSYSQDSIRTCKPHAVLAVHCKYYDVYMYKCIYTCMCTMRMYMYNVMSVRSVFLSPDYNVNFFKQFSLVMNALDNKGICHTSTFISAVMILASSPGPSHKGGA